MGQQTVRCITPDLVAVRRNHEFCLHIERLLVHVLVQDIRRNQGLPEDQVDQLALVVGRNIGSDVLACHPLRHEASVLIRESLDVRINVGAAHELVAHILHGSNVLRNLELTIGHYMCIRNQVIPVSLIQLWFRQSHIDLVNQFLVHALLHLVWQTLLELFNSKGIHRQ